MVQSKREPFLGKTPLVGARATQGGVENYTVWYEKTIEAQSIERDGAHFAPPHLRNRRSLTWMMKAELMF